MPTQVAGLGALDHTPASVRPLDSPLSRTIGGAPKSTSRKRPGASGGRLPRSPGAGPKPSASIGVQSASSQQPIRAGHDRLPGAPIGCAIACVILTVAPGYCRASSGGAACLRHGAALEPVGLLQVGDHLLAVLVVAGEVVVPERVHGRPERSI